MLRHPAGNVYAFASPHARIELVRSHLWQLPAWAHCAVLGTCLSSDDLRGLLDALFAGHSDSNDYTLHAGAVRECASHNKLSALLDSELDRRFAAEIDRVAETDAAGLRHEWTSALPTLVLARRSGRS